MVNNRYRDLEEIRARKDELRALLRKDDEHMRTLWNGLFHKPDMLAAATPTKRFSGLLNTGAGVIDAAILGWKLYRKFNSNKKSGKKRR